MPFTKLRRPHIGDPPPRQARLITSTKTKPQVRKQFSPSVREKRTRGTGPSYILMQECLLTRETGAPHGA